MATKCGSTKCKRLSVAIKCSGVDAARDGLVCIVLSGRGRNVCHTVGEVVAWDRSGEGDDCQAGEDDKGTGDAGEVGGFFEEDDAGNGADGFALTE